MPASPWRVWLALVAPPFVLAVCFAPLVAWVRLGLGVPDEALQREIEARAAVPATVAFVLVALGCRWLARIEGLPGLGWTRPTPLQLALGLGAGLGVAALDQWWLYPLLRAAQPSFDPTLASTPLALVVLTLGSGIVAEESLYRGVAWQVLRARHGPVVAAGATALAYTLLAPGFEWPLKAWALGFGLLLAALRPAAGGLWPLALAHALASLAPRAAAALGA